MNIGEAVKERILQLCSERNISINNLSSMSGVTQSTVNNIVGGRNRSTTIRRSKSFAMVWGSQLRNFSNPNCSGIWNRKFNKKSSAVYLEDTNTGNSLYNYLPNSKNIHIHCKNCQKQTIIRLICQAVGFIMKLLDLWTKIQPSQSFCTFILPVILCF